MGYHGNYKDVFGVTHLFYSERYSDVLHEVNEAERLSVSNEVTVQGYAPDYRHMGLVWVDTREPEFMLKFWDPDTLTWIIPARNVYAPGWAQDDREQFCHYAMVVLGGAVGDAEDIYRAERRGR